MTIIVDFTLNILIDDDENGDDDDDDNNDGDDDDNDDDGDDSIIFYISLFSPGRIYCGIRNDYLMMLMTTTTKGTISEFICFFDFHAIS